MHRAALNGWGNRMSYVVNAAIAGSTNAPVGRQASAKPCPMICISQIAQSGHGNIRTLRRAWAFPRSPTRDSIASV
jgi:hypothetical protein